MFLWETQDELPIEAPTEIETERAKDKLRGARGRLFDATVAAKFAAICAVEAGDAFHDAEVELRILEYRKALADLTDDQLVLLRAGKLEIENAIALRALLNELEK